MNIFDNLDLAESKLIVLYAMHKLNMPVTNNQLTNIMIENNIMNYFYLQQYLIDLKNSNFITTSSDNNKQFYIITDEGEKILNYFINRVPLTVKEKIENLVQSNADKIKQEIEITADYIPENENEYIVECRVNENKTNLIDLKINVPNKHQAKVICDNWTNNTSIIFGEILDSLTKTRE